MVHALARCWEHDFLISGNGVISPIAIETAGLVVAHAAAQLVAFELEHGAVRYRRRTKSLVSGLAVAGETLAVRDGFEPGANTLVLDASTGEGRREIVCIGRPTGLVAMPGAFAWEEREDTASCLVIADAVSGEVSRFPLPVCNTDDVFARGDRIVLVRQAATSSDVS